MNIFNDLHQKFLIELLRQEVEFIVVGGLSVVFHGYIRTTGDMDLWIRPQNDNKEKLIRVLETYHFSAESIMELRKKDFADIIAFHFNGPPDKIEFLTAISGLNFDKSYAQCDHLIFNDFRIPFLSYEDLITNKISSGRLKDLADVDELKKIHRKG